MKKLLLSGKSKCRRTLALILGCGLCMMVLGAYTPVLAEEPAAEAPAPAATLAVGSNSAEVSALQESLAKLGFLTGPVDGDFGNMTKTALENFQSSFGFAVTGEADPELQDLIASVAGGVAAGVPEGQEPSFVWNFGSASVEQLADGTWFVAPNTVSNATFEKLQKLVQAATAASQEAGSLPDTDTVNVVILDASTLPEGSSLAEAATFAALATYVKENGAELSVSDANGNALTVAPDGNITSETGNILVQSADRDTLELSGEAAEVSVESLAAEIHPDPNAISFLGMKYTVAEDGSYQVIPETISRESLMGLYQAFGSMGCAYLASDAIPADEEMVAVDIMDLPEGITAEDVRFDASTGSYLIGTAALSAKAAEAGQDIQIKDESGNVVTVTGTGDISSDTGSISTSTGSRSAADVNTAAAQQASQQPAAAPSQQQESSNSSSQQPAAAPSQQQSSSGSSSSAQSSSGSASSTPAPAPAPEPQTPAPAPTPTPEPQTQPPHTHSYTGAVTQPATCSSPGVMTYTCSCGDSYTETIPATGQHVTQEVPHYYLDHYSAPQYICNYNDYASASLDDLEVHMLNAHGDLGSYHVDSVLEYTEDLGTTYVDGCYVQGWYDICVNCGAVVASH